MPETADHDEIPSDADLGVEVRRLHGQIKALRVDVQAKTAETRRRTKLLAKLLTLVALIGGILGVFVIQATIDNADAIAESNRRWCPVISPFAPRAGDPPPVGDPEQVQRSLRIRAAFAKLLNDFDCR